LRHMGVIVVVSSQRKPNLAYSPCSYITSTLSKGKQRLPPTVASSKITMAHLQSARACKYKHDQFNHILHSPPSAFRSNSNLTAVMMPHLVNKLGLKNGHFTAPLCSIVISHHGSTLNFTTCSSAQKANHVRMKRRGAPGMCGG
jgi:hypothetical protein